MKTRVSLKYFANACLWKHFLLLTCPRPPQIFFDNSGNSKAFHSKAFNLKIKKLSCKKEVHFPLLGNCFSDLFTEVEIGN